MYPDPNRVRTERITVRLDQYEHKLLSALAEYQGEPPATLLRAMFVREAMQVLGGSVDSDMSATVPALSA